MDTTVLLTDGKDGTNMVSTDAAVRAGLANVANPSGKIEQFDSVNVLTCAGLKDNMLEAIGGTFYWKENSINNEMYAKGYHQVEYIQSDGTAWIDTGVQGGNAYEYELDYMYSTWSKYAAVFGNYVDENSYVCRLIMTASDNGTAFPYNNTRAGSGLSVLGNEKNKWHHAFLGSKSATIDGNSVVYSTAKGNANNTKIALFTSKVGSNGANIGAKMKSFVIRDLEGNKIRDFIPCYDTNSQKYGMYDDVNDKFYPSNGSGNFSAGARIKPLSYAGILMPFTNTFATNIPSNHFPINETTYLSTITIQQGVFSPAHEKYYDTLRLLHEMYKYLQIFSSELDCFTQKFNIGPFGIRLLDNINQIWSLINIYPKDINTIGVSAMPRLFTQNFGTENYSEVITNIQYALTPIVKGSTASISEGTPNDQHVDLTILEEDYKYNYVDSYKLSLIIDFETINGIQNIATERIIDASSISNLNIPKESGYEIVGNILYKDEQVFAYDVVCAIEQDGSYYVLFADGSTYKLGDPKPEIKLPSNLQFASYIESDGKEWINTGVHGNSGLEFEIEYLYKVWAKYAAVFGNYVDENSYVCRLIMTASDNGTAFPYNNTRAGSGLSVLGNEKNKWHHAYLGSKSATIDGNSVVYNTASGTSNATEIVLFSSKLGSISSNIGLQMRLFRIKKDGILIRDYIPVYNTDSKEFGMYDIVNKEFYGNNGTGKFAGIIE